MNNFNFGGSTFDAERDGERLQGQLARVAQVMVDGDWHTLPELAQKCGGTEAAISARIRDFRKAKFGGHTVQREYVERGLWRYRLILSTPSLAGFEA
jgi:hypothetical protein